MFTGNSNEVIQADKSIENIGKAVMRQENLIWRKAVEDILDPTSDMTEEERTVYLNRIMAKLKSGKDLTQEELNFLRIHHPELYMKAMRIKHCKEGLKERLKKCRSKEEVNDVINSTIGGISDKDPDKEYLVAAYNEVAKEFKKTSGYTRLPDTEKDRLEKEKKNGRRDSVGMYSDDEGSGGDESDITPIQELLDILPVFEANA